MVDGDKWWMVDGGGGGRGRHLAGHLVEHCRGAPVIAGALGVCVCGGGGGHHLGHLGVMRVMRVTRVMVVRVVRIMRVMRS